MQTKRWFIAAAALVLIPSCADDKTRSSIATSATLTLVREKNFADLLERGGSYEASGIALDGDKLRVVFDNTTSVAAIDLALSGGNLGPGARSSSQFEGITMGRRPIARTYVVKEVGARDRGTIVTLDAQGNLVATEPTDITFGNEGKGLEGVAWLDDVERLLVLCEASACGAASGRTGQGVLKALRHENNNWVTETTVALPETAGFADFSDVAVMPETGGTYRIAVLSQETAALWVGELTTAPLTLSSPGVVYGFPRAAGKVQYCSLEGVTFIDRTTFAMVSDRLKDEGGCNKGEALHVFAIP